MRVLFIALEFPPLSNTGVHRSAKLAKYLPEFGVEPVVIRLCPEDASKSFGSPLDDGLMSDFSADLPIYSFAAPAPVTNSSRVSQFIQVWGRLEDSFGRRVRSALMKALPALVARHRPSAVYVSMPPFSAGGLAASIADDLHLPLIVDMRDGWSHWCVAPFSTYAHWALVHRKERKLFEQASAVVTVTEQLANVFRRSHPDISPARFHVVSNGYDAPLDVPASLSIPLGDPSATMTIGYVGGFYYSPESRDIALTPWWRRPRHRKLNYVPVREDYLYRSPHFFFRAWSELKRRDPLLGNRLRFVLVGEKPPWLDAMAAEHGLGDAVECLGRVTNRRVAELTQTFDALLCTSTKVEGGEDYALTSKTFDYVRAGKPILGWVTKGSQKEFLERSGMSLLVDPDDLEAGVEALTRLVRGGFTLRPNRSFLAQYHRRALAERMANIILEAAHQPSYAESLPLSSLRSSNA